MLSLLLNKVQMLGHRIGVWLVLFKRKQKAAQHFPKVFGPFYTPANNV